MRSFPCTIGVIVSTLCLAVGPVRAQERLSAEDAAASPDNPYTPPSCVPGVPFADITCTTGFDPWIEQFGADGITAGCGGGNYCPGSPVTRDEMAVFVEKAMHGTGNWTPGNLGNFNTGVGAFSLPYSTTGGYNTGLGYYSLHSNTTGQNNAGVGYGSLFSNTTAIDNTGVGVGSLESTTTGSNNTGVGDGSLQYNTTGGGNTGVGEGSLHSNTTGGADTAVGYGADVASDSLGDATAIGAYATVDASYHVRIGDTNVTQIGGQVAWSNLSDIRAKTDIQDLDLGLDFVMALRPVSFTLKQGNGRTDLGFIAQDVETLVGDGYNVLGIGGDTDRTLSLRYTDFIAPMVKAIQEQQATITAQQAEVNRRDARTAALEARVAELEAQVKALLAARPTPKAADRP